MKDHKQRPSIWLLNNPSTSLALPFGAKRCGRVVQELFKSQKLKGYDAETMLSNQITSDVALSFTDVDFNLFSIDKIGECK